MSPWSSADPVVLAKAKLGKCSLPKEKVHKCWQEDERFGYQFLNGTNPMLLRHSTSLPSRLVLPPGTEKLGAQVKKELQNGSLFEADFILLDRIPTSVIQGEKQHLAAPLVMMMLKPNGKLLPMVIQILHLPGSWPSPGSEIQISNCMSSNIIYPPAG